MNGKMNWDLERILIQFFTPVPSLDSVRFIWCFIIKIQKNPSATTPLHPPSPVSRSPPSARQTLPPRLRWKLILWTFCLFLVPFLIYPAKANPTQTHNISMAKLRKPNWFVPPPPPPPSKTNISRQQKLRFPNSFGINQVWVLKKFRFTQK